MNTTKNTCWRCRKCGAATPLGEAICSNPSCQAELSLYGETFTPKAPTEPLREEPPRYDTPPSSNLWEERPKEPEKKAEQKPSGSEKKSLRKQQAEARVREAAERRSLHNRGPVKSFFLAALVILVSLIAGILSGGIMLMSFTYWGDVFYYEFGIGYLSRYYPMPFLWHQILPGVLVLVLSFVFARLAVKDTYDRKLMLATIGFWAIPFVISCLKRFSHDGGDSYEMLSVYLFFLFNMEPILVGATYAGIKGLQRASSILRWLGVLMLIATGVIALILSLDTYLGGIL